MSYETSTETSELFKAMAAFQARVSTASKDAKNTFFKSSYTTLAAAWRAVQEAMAGTGLAVMQPIVTRDGEAGVLTLVTHESGQWLKTEPTMLPLKERTPQAAGSAVTYARRYSLMSVMGIASDDDDGEAAMEAHRGGRHSRSSGAQRTNAGRAGNQSTRAEKVRHEPLRREDLPSEALSVYDPMLRVSPAEAEAFGRWVSGPGKAGGPEVLVKGVEQAREVLADLCGHKHWEATGNVTACARCGFVRPDDEEPESMADALGVAEDEVPF